MNPRTSLSLATSLAAVALLAGASAQATTLANGGFETGDFTGWTQFGNVDLTGVDMLTAHDGTFSAYFGPATTPGGILQTLNTTVGASYTVDFWLRNENAASPGMSNAFTFTWGAMQVMNLTDANVSPYTHYSFNLTAVQTHTDVKFGFRNDAGFWDLDSVSAVPEPTSMALMSLGLGLGLLGMGAARRRRAD